MSQKKAFAGTLESNDIYIIIEERSGEGDVQIDLESIVLAQYGQSIRETIMSVLKAEGVTRSLYMKANDKGALPCTIEARVKTVLGRAGLLKGEIS
ncbi:MAG: citrate lyase acyl carrier protein [Saezia sp.]